MTMNRFLPTFLSLLWLAAASLLQGQTFISDVTPSSAATGASALTVDITMGGMPQPPPADRMPTSVTIGELAGTNFSRDNRNHVAATFDIPADMALGDYDVTVVFTTPMGELQIIAEAAFSVTSEDAPPVITEQPQSAKVPVGRAITFRCQVSSTSAVTYQWYHRNVVLEGAISASLTIDPVEGLNGGPYYCVATNEFGTAETNTAFLEVFSDAYLPVYAIVDTNQTRTYDDVDSIAQPVIGEPFIGQDGQYTGNVPFYWPSDDGLTVYDNITRLTWTQTTDTNGDGEIDINDKMTLQEAQAYVDELNAETYGGFDDWRLPSIKEIYSLMDFSGVDASGMSQQNVRPFIDTNFFAFGYGDVDNGERVIDAQYVSTTQYVSTVFGNQQAVFGLNLADGRIKGYPLNLDFYVLAVRGGMGYGVNQFVDNGDGTITDRATGLMWQQADNGEAMGWGEALDYAFDLEHAGYRDWRLPNAKELQSILDYTRSPDTTSSPAIDPLFTLTAITNEAGQIDYPWLWTSTTHLNTAESPAAHAVYFCFGRGMGYFNDEWLDVHGAGAQRSDPKSGVLADYPYAPDGYYNGNAGQGDAIRIDNFVLCVRGGARPPFADADEDELPDWYEYDYTGAATSMEPGGDDDGDLFTNLQEFRAGTFPDDAQSFIKTIGITNEDGSVTFRWASSLDKFYRVYESTDLEEFTPVTDPILGAPPVNEITLVPDTLPTFYRVQVSPPPSAGGPGE